MSPGLTPQIHGFCDASELPVQPGSPTFFVAPVIDTIRDARPSNSGVAGDACEHATAIEASAPAWSRTRNVRSGTATAP